MTHYNLREYPQAIAAFEEGYRIHPDPVFLFNIAQSHRFAERNAEALHFYRAYLSAAPKAPNRREVEARIDELRALVAAQKTASAAPPQGSMVPSVVEKPAPASVVEKPAPPPPAPPVVVEKPAPTPIAVVEKPAPVRRDRRWVWGVVAGGIVVVGLGVGLGVGLTVGRSSTNSYPAVTYALEGGVR